MGKLLLWMHQSVDGYCEGPGGAWDFGWPTVTAEMQRTFVAQARAARAFVYGRVTFEGMAGYWPTVDENAPNEDEAEFARIWREKPKVVFSRSLREAGWNTRTVADDPAATAAALKAEGDGDLILFGGAKLAGALLRADAFDEFYVFVHPVLLGGGRPLFSPFEERRPLRLVSSRTFSPGVVLNHHERVREDG